MPLRYLIKNAPILDFEIAVTNADGSRKTDTQMEIANEVAAQKGKKGKKAQNIAKGGKSNAAKIQFLLD